MGTVRGQMTIGECIGCVFCGSAVDPEHGDYQWTSGWVRKRGGGGANALRGREEHERFACRFCVEKLAKGINPQQERLC